MFRCDVYVRVLVNNSYNKTNKCVIYSNHLVVHLTVPPEAAAPLTPHLTPSKAGHVGSTINTLLVLPPPPPPPWRSTPQWAMASFLRFLDHTRRHATLGRTPLGGWSALCRDIYLTTHINKHSCSRRDSNPQSQQASDHWDRHSLRYCSSFLHWLNPPGRTRALGVDSGLFLLKKWVLSYSIEQSPSWEANRFVASQKPEGLLPHSLLPATCLYPELAQSSPCVPLSLFRSYHSVSPGPTLSVNIS
jgi:hypothetical protein